MPGLSHAPKPARSGFAEGWSIYPPYPIGVPLPGASTLQQANQVLTDYLPRFNAQFAVPAAEVRSAYRPWSAQLGAEEVFCFKYLRTAGLDNVVTFAGHRLQIEPDQQRRSYARAEVEVHERFGWQPGGLL